MAVTSTRQGESHHRFPAREGGHRIPGGPGRASHAAHQRSHDHFKSNVKDHHSRRGLLRMCRGVASSSITSSRATPDSYRALIDRLGLRK